jgi:hypothetical protein
MFSKSFNPREAIERVQRCGHYFFTEQFAEGMTALGAKLGIDLPVMHVRPTGRNYDITEADRERARDLLADEYVMIDALRASAS